MAIVSKAIFEKAIKGEQDVGPGKVLGFERYVSTNKNLEQLASGGSLFLVTVRPPDERLWLVAILERPTFTGKEWVAPKNTTAISDITDQIPKLRFSSGKGLAPKKGALGMSLQTPRGLVDSDEAILRAAAGSGDDVMSLLHGDLIHLNAHEPDSIPCLCKRCIDPALSRVTVEGESFVRAHAVAKGRVLFYWIPESLEHDERKVRRAVEARLYGRLA